MSRAVIAQLGRKPGTSTGRARRPVPNLLPVRMGERSAESRSCRWELPGLSLAQGIACIPHPGDPNSLGLREGSITRGAGRLLSFLSRGGLRQPRAAQRDAARQVSLLRSAAQVVLASRSACLSFPAMAAARCA
jgi:hypothetical protein